MEEPHNKEDKLLSPRRTIDQTASAVKSPSLPNSSNPTGVQLLNIDNSFKIVQLAVEFSKNGKDILKLADEDKKSNFSKMTKIAKKLVPSQALKLMKLNASDIDRKRHNTLQEFVFITEKLKTRILNSKEQDGRMAEDIRQFLQEGHMILAAIMLTEINLLISMFTNDNSSISRPNLLRLLTEVKNYSDSVNTMKFPTEWEHLINELCKKSPNTSGGGGGGGSGPTSVTTTNNQGSNASQRTSTKKKVGLIEHDGPPLKVHSENESEKDSDGEGNETHTVQIEIRGNTGGFVGCPIEFDLVVTHEDGSPVSVHASDFAVEINGPATGSSVVISAKGKEEDGAFRIEFIPSEAGANTLSIFMHNTLLTSGIKSIISKAGETAFLIHSNDICRGQLQGNCVISIPPDKTLSTTTSSSRVNFLKQKLDDISSALELLEALRVRTQNELHNSNTSNNLDEQTVQ